MPHGNNTWSYVRYGERAQGTIAPAVPDERDGTFEESARFNPTFKSKYFDSDGESAGASSRASWSWTSPDDDDNSYRVNSGSDSAANKSTFDWDASDGVLDYIDGNRTTITMGDH